jgi:hypothetical protein
MLEAEGQGGVGSSRLGLTFSGAREVGKDSAGAPPFSMPEADAPAGDTAGSVEGHGGTTGALFSHDV